MPRKTKEQKKLEDENKIQKPTKKATTKKATPKKATTSSKMTTGKKSTVTKKSTTAKKSTNTSQKDTSTKKATSRSTAIKKTSTTKKTSSQKTSKKKIDIVEYYDLPYRYNETIVKVLAQTPTNLFIYWDISDKDRKNLEEQYGNDFFEKTKPILIIYNKTLGYHFEIEINDFANSWYLHVADSKSNYQIELGRRPIIKTENLNIDYIYITNSNEIESPNDRILFDPNQKMVYFRNVKTGKQTQKQISSISFIRNMGKIYDIYDLYKAIYQDEKIEKIYNLSNPSSGNPFSGSLLSKSK